MRSLTRRTSVKLPPVLILTSVLCLIVAPLMSGRREAPARPGDGTQTLAQDESARGAYGRMPMSFEANRGQAEGSVDFLARGAGYALFLRPTEAVFVLRNDEGVASVNRKSEIRNPKSKVLRMRLAGANAGARAEGSDELSGKANYFVGDDPSKWRANVETFARVRYAEVYEGVDLVYYGNQRQLEYDFRVAAGADARAVSLEFEGADEVEVSEGGDLRLKVGGETMRQQKPFAYQETAGARREVACGYALERGGRVRFELGEYDASLPLVIDPVLVYSTYLGGSFGDDARAVAVDSAGSAYVVGFTRSADFPTASPLQATNTGAVSKVFVTKFNPAGTALVYSTYLGGNSSAEAFGVGVDSSGNAYVTGAAGDGFPLVNPLQPNHGGGGRDTFVAKLNAAGSALVYSTYLGGGGGEIGADIAVDSSGNAYVTGVTSSTDFPTVSPIQAAHAVDAYVTKINAAGSALVYSTHLGGTDTETGKSIAVDSSGSAYVTGDTFSQDFPVVNALQPAPGSFARDAFVTKLNAAGTALVYSTYLGGSRDDFGEGIAVDSSGGAYVTGDTESTDFPTANAVQPTIGTVEGIMHDAFVTKLNPAGTGLVYSTYVGGGKHDAGQDIAVDSAGNAYVAGYTTSTDFPTAAAIQCALSGLSNNIFVTKLNAAGNAFVYSTYIGGGLVDAIAADSSGNAYVAGGADSDFPAVNAFQGAYAGSDFRDAGDGFVLKLSDDSSGPASQLQFTLTNPTVQEDVTFVTLTVQRTGDTSGPVTVDYATADGTASERSDYTTALGTLRFAAGETSKTIDVLVNEDSKIEGNETFTVNLSNPTGGATLSCLTAAATVQITDDAVEPTANVIDDPTIFVGTHYHDFLNRQADATGLAFWISQITSCGANAACVDNKRTNVSQAFFLSIEFEQTGFLVFRFYKASFTDSPARPRGLPRYREFLRDTQEIGRGVVVGSGAWEAQLEANKEAFARRWVQRPEFLSEFPASMEFDEFIAKLAANSGVTLTPTEINFLFEGWSNDVEGRAKILRRVIEFGSVFNKQFNPAFVLSQYIGYLRRNPNDPPDNNFTGFDFWLAKLDSFSLPGEDVRDPLTAQRRVQRAEMVRAFIISAEYRQRFGP